MVMATWLFDGESNVGAADRNYWPVVGIAEAAAGREWRGHVRKAEQAEEGNEGGNAKEWGHKSRPSILELQDAIAEDATRCGRRRGWNRSKLAKDYQLRWRWRKR